MKFSVTWVFLLLFGVVAGFYSYLKPRPFQSDNEETKTRPTLSAVEQPLLKPSPSDEDEQASPSEDLFSAMKLFPLEKGDSLQWLQIQNLKRDETITMIFNKGQWMIKYPVYYLANQKLTAELVHVITSTQKIRILDAPRDWEEYGLERPFIKIGVETKNQPTRRYLYLGNESPIDESIFARWEDEEGYFLLPPNFKDFFDHSLYVLREKRAFRMESTRIHRMRVQSRAEGYELAKQGKRWIWKKPSLIHGKWCSPKAMTKLIHQVKGLFIKDYLDDEKGDPKAFGVSNSGVYITLWRDDDHFETLYLGNETPVRDAFYARLEGDTVFALVARNNIRALFQSVSAMASDRIVAG